MRRDFAWEVGGPYRKYVHKCSQRCIEPSRWQLRRCGRCRFRPATCRRHPSTLRPAEFISDRRRSMSSRAPVTAAALCHAGCSLRARLRAAGLCAGVRCAHFRLRAGLCTGVRCAASAPLMRRAMHRFPHIQRLRSQSMAQDRPSGHGPTCRPMARNSHRGRPQSCPTATAAVAWSATAGCSAIEMLRVTGCSRSYWRAPARQPILKIEP